MRLQKGKVTAIYNVAYRFLLWCWRTTFSSFVEVLLLSNSAIQLITENQLLWLQHSNLKSINYFKP